MPDVGLFLVSHLSTAAYALVNRGDWSMASIFLANTAIWLRAAYKRQLLRVPRRPFALALR